MFLRIKKKKKTLIDEHVKNRFEIFFLPCFIWIFNIHQFSGTPWTGCQSITGLTERQTILTHVRTYGQFKIQLWG